jgi:HPt (histidine-containing phosphotransfer) domain-containing protein
MTGNEDHAAKMAALRSRFMDRARQESRELSALAGTAGSPEVKMRMVHLAHGLAGSAGVFGLADLSRAAGVLEEAILAEASDDDIRLATDALALALPEEGR